MSRENQEDQSILVETSLKVFLTRFEVGIGETTIYHFMYYINYNYTVTGKYCKIWPEVHVQLQCKSTKMIAAFSHKQFKIPLTTSQTRSFKWMPAMSCVRFLNTQQNTHLDYLCDRSTKIWRYIKSSEEIQCPIYRRMNGTITSSLI